MEETIQTAPTKTVSVEQPSPQGIGMAIAFDWGISVQLLVMPFLPLLFKNLVPFELGNIQTSALKLGSLPNVLVSFLASLPFAALLAVFGEGIRRGWRWTRPVQVVANTLGFLGGFAMLGNAWQGIKTGNYWPLVPTVILLIFSPLIAFRLSRKATGQWFRTVSSIEARKRHSGAWPWLIAVWAVIGGILQALAASQR